MLQVTKRCFLLFSISLTFLFGSGSPRLKQHPRSSLRFCQRFIHWINADSGSLEAQGSFPRFGWINILRRTDLSEWKADTLGGTIGSPLAKQVGAPESSFCPTVFFLSGVGFKLFGDRSLMRCRCRCPQTTSLVCFVEFECAKGSFGCLGLLAGYLSTLLYILLGLV